MMKENSKKGKGNDVNASDDTLGENTEKTPLAKEVEKDRRAKEEQSKSKKK
jgi:hypothetical protein